MEKWKSIPGYENIYEVSTCTPILRVETMTNLKRDAMAYSNALSFFRQLRNCRDMLTTQQLKTLKGQALAGDVSGAWKGLLKIIRRGYGDDA